MPAGRMTVTRYPPGRGWYLIETTEPRWDQVETALRQMDDRDYPILQLSWKDVESCYDDEQSFNVIGRVEVGFAHFEFMPGWLYEDPAGSDEEVRLWQSDQGYVCQRKHVADFATAMRLARVYFDTGSYEELSVRRPPASRSTDQS